MSALLNWHRLAQNSRVCELPHIFPARLGLKARYVHAHGGTDEPLSDRIAQWRAVGCAGVTGCDHSVFMATSRQETDSSIRLGKDPVRNPACRLAERWSPCRHNI